MSTVLSLISPITVAFALKKAQAASLQSVLLTQRASVLDENLLKIANEQSGTPIGAAARGFVDARAQLNRVIRDQVKAAVDESKQLSSKYLSEIFGTAVPGPVSLPLERGEHVTHNVNGLARLLGAKEGILDVTTRGGGTDTVRFYELGGKYVFAEPDLY